MVKLWLVCGNLPSVLWHCSVDISEIRKIHSKVLFDNLDKFVTRVLTFLAHVKFQTVVLSLPVNMVFSNKT